ncbi:MAG: AAA family ATPase [Lentimicrobiaceae bacterium]|nr:AAA family ATPase [Lentimicrobiaceae bacterium]
MNELNQEQLSRIYIKGFKSIKECDLELSNINVLIGSNGAGKTNLISVFEMLQNILEQELSYYVGKKGGVTSLFYNGKETTDSISTEFYFGSLVYTFELEWTDNNNLLFRSESIINEGKEIMGKGGHSESKVKDEIQKISINTKFPKMMSNPSWRVYRFQDTTSSSRIKSEQNISNDISLMSDGRNLAAFLYRLKNCFPKEYTDILRAVQLVAPFFKDFVLSPNELNNEQIVLRWQHKTNKDVFYAMQLSDGTLRFICLAALLLQPKELQPEIIIIDEPELGLHPFAITIFAEMVQKAAVQRQVIFATQSAELLNCFSPDDIVVAEYDIDGSKFKRMSSKQLAYWIENDYSIGEMWNNNILGGRFAR